MTLRCKICHHPDRHKIDMDVRKGKQSKAKIAAQYGVPKSSLYRHARSHLLIQLISPPKPANPPKQKDKPKLLDPSLVDDTIYDVPIFSHETSQVSVHTIDRDMIIGAVKYVMTEAEGIYNELRQAGDMHGALKALAEYRKNIRLIADMDVSFEDTNAVDFLSTDSWKKIQDVLYKLKKRYPETGEFLSEAF